jgi:hypothetical protein
VYETCVESSRQDCVAVEWALTQRRNNILLTRFLHGTMGRIEKRGDSYFLLFNNYYQDV